MSLLLVKIKTEEICPYDIPYESIVGTDYDDITVLDEKQTFIKSDPSLCSPETIENNLIKQELGNTSSLVHIEPVRLRNPSPIPHSSETNDSSSNDDPDFSLDCGRIKEEPQRVRSGNSVNPPHICSVCNKSYKFLCRLLAHQKTHLEVKPFKCHQCTKTFSNITLLKTHFMVHSDERPFKCKLCDKSYKRKSRLQTHELIHTKFENLKCELKRNKLKKPEKSIVKGELTLINQKAIPDLTKTNDIENRDEFNLECGSDEGKRLGLKTKLIFESDKCEKSYDSKDTTLKENHILIRHETTHCHYINLLESEKILHEPEETRYNEYPYPCEKCGEAFIEISHLRAHEVMHSEVRPLKYGMCEKSFSSKNDFVSHYTYHSEYRAISSDKCGRTFQEKSNLSTRKRYIDRFSQNTSILSVAKETADESLPDSTDEAIVGIEFDDVDPIERLISIKTEPSNFSPVVSIKTEPEDILALINAEQPRSSTTQRPTTNITENNGIKYEEITDAFEGQTTIRQEPSICQILVVVKQEPEDILSLKNTKLRDRLTTPYPFTNTTETNNNKYKDMADDFESPVSINSDPSSYSSLVLENILTEQDAEDIAFLENTTPPKRLRKPSPIRHSTETNDSSSNDDPDSSLDFESDKSKREEQHRVGSSNSVNVTHICSVCKKKFKYQCRLLAHEKSHFEIKPFSCDQCTKTFSNITQLKTHFMVHSDERPFRCKLCDKSYKRKARLKVHERVHSVQVYKGDECQLGKNLSKSKNMLENHLKVQLDRSYQCKKCGKSFKEKRYLRVHQAVHSEDRPFQCSKCEKTYKSKRDLNCHKKIHLENEPFNCNECKGTFEMSANPHKCCLHRFPQNTLLSSVAIEISEEHPPEFSDIAIVGIEFDDVMDNGEKSIK